MTTDKPEGTKTEEELRVDQKLLMRGQQLLQLLLEQTPELQSASLVFSYSYQDAGSLPAGTFMARDNKMTLREMQRLYRAGVEMNVSVANTILGALDSLIKQTNQQEKPSGESEEEGS